MARNLITAPVWREPEEGVPGVVPGANRVNSVYCRYGSAFQPTATVEFSLAAVAVETEQVMPPAISLTGKTLRFWVILVTVVSGTTAAAAVRNLVFTDGASGTEIFRIAVPIGAYLTHHWLCSFDNYLTLTAENALCCSLDGAIGTGYTYSVSGAYTLT